MKTLKITDELHHDLLKLKAELNVPTLSTAIRFLYDYRRNVIIVHQKAIKNGNK